MAIVLALLVAMGPVCERLGGGHPALYNPANNGFVWATGSGTAREHIVRSVSCHPPGAWPHSRPRGCWAMPAGDGLHQLSAMAVCICCPVLRCQQPPTARSTRLQCAQVAQACGALGGVLLARALLPPAWTK